MTRPGFLIAVAALIVNDVVLKPRFPGIVTGKLSDVAGLFAFVVFWAAFAPRWRWQVGGATALAFVWWKSPLSQPVVDALHLHRTIDATDLVALIVIPFACAYVRAERTALRPATLLIAVVSLFAFANTSWSHHACCRGDYLMPFENEAALIKALRDRGIFYEHRDWEGRRVRTLNVKTRVCGRNPSADVEIVPAERGTILRVIEVVYYCPNINDWAAQAAFEDAVIEPLGGHRL